MINNGDTYSCFQRYFCMDETVRIIFTRSGSKIKKIVVKPVIIKNEKKWQIESYCDNKTFHVNLSLQELLTEIEQKIIGVFKQINIININSSIQLLISKKGKIDIKETQTDEREQKLDHNKIKNYIFREGEDIAPLKDLGIFTQDNKIINSKYDKYKQINRFIQVIDDEFKNFEKNEITIIDFGCGKSYLTFLVYYYFKFIRNIDPKIYGYDLKQDIVDSCNKITGKYGYTNLKFFNTDITDTKEMNYKADMIITLHACDTVTDYALFNAISNNINYIFSVPCCQHEINSQIETSHEMNLLLNDGLIKERFSALLTDAIRCEFLRQEGYKVDVVEFVDFSHSPKNLMIRAKLNKKKKSDYENIDLILKQFNCKQTLFSLITGVRETE
jgi:hypothetical protein